MTDVMSDGKADGKANGASSFAIRAEATSEALPRIVGLFAQRSIMPRRLTCEQQGDRLSIAIDTDALDEWVASILLEKLRSMVLVDHAVIVGEA